MTQDKLNKVTQELQLTGIQQTKLDPTQILFNLLNTVNNFSATQDLTDTGNYNIFSSGIRSLQSNLVHGTDENDKIYLKYLSDKLRRLTDIDDKIRTQYSKLDHVNMLLHERVAERLYSTLESKTPGALSQYIANRIMERDSNFILGVFGQVRSGKSMAASRVGLNVAELTGLKLTLADVVYSHKDYVVVKDNRREQGILKGSVQIPDEGGNIADSQTWWEEDVRRIVKHLRTQGFDNTCTIIISPMYMDIANKARGLFHAVMYPWKEFGKRYMKLTDTGNIDYQRNLSSWKLDFLDTDPMTGKTYPGKLKAALGDIIKVDTSIPPKKWITPYQKKAEEYKLSLQKLDKKEEQERKVMRRDPEFYREIIQKVMENPDRYISVTKSSGHTRVNRELLAADFDLGITTAMKIKAMMEADLNE